MTESELLAAVEAVFVVTGRGLSPWPHPHSDRSPQDEEYSRLSDPAKWRILGARAQAWIEALAATGLATVEPGTPDTWLVEPGPAITRVDRVVPRAAGALDLTVARTPLGHVDDAGVTLGVGHPAICVGVFPDCGCDACDSGSQAELDDLDRHLLGIVSGAFRRLSNGPRTITVIAPHGWRASGVNHREVEAVLADPRGWTVTTGTSWLRSS